jgi:hypothetical protein
MTMVADDQALKDEILYTLLISPSRGEARKEEPVMIADKFTMTIDQGQKKAEGVLNSKFKNRCQIQLNNDL